MAGGLKRASPLLGEDLVLIRALRDSNQPKFLAEDTPLLAARAMGGLRASKRFEFTLSATLAVG